ncbi:uncharacterized protein ASCRUDRAFT_77996, partial [Ascoidea rubescens DSM 1968]
MNFNPLQYDQISKESIDLNPIYDAILIYQTIDDLESLKTEFNKEWNKKKERLVYPAFNN